MATSERLDPAVLKRTRDTLGKVIKKPPLTEKLLLRPPFRYLHDIISEVMRGTGFFKGLYSGSELDARSIQDREAKLAFLQKAIDTLSFTTGEVVKVKASKIVAGQEPERTNEFLQILAISIMKKLDSAESVQRVLQGDKPSDSLPRERKQREKGARREGGPAKGEGCSERRRRSGEEGVRGEREKKAGSSGEDRGRSGDDDRVKEPPAGGGSLPDEPASAPERPQHRPSRHHPDLLDDPVPSPTGSRDEAGGLGSETLLERPSSAKGPRRKPQQAQGVGPGGDTPLDSGGMAGKEGTGARGQSPSPAPGLVSASQRPSTARPAPPKVLRHNSATEEAIPRITSGSAVAGPAVILDHPEGEEEEEGEGDEEVRELVVGDSTADAAPIVNGLVSGLGAGEEQPEGALTKAIVATKQRLEGDMPAAEASGFPAISAAQRRKERDLVAREIGRLQSSIQTLCRTANPLGRIMDYVQEDMDSMQKELEMWRQENIRHAEVLAQEQSVTERELAPLQAQLEELEAQARQQEDLISAAKANVLRNEERTRQMLNSVSLPAS